MKQSLTQKWCDGMKELIETDYFKQSIRKSMFGDSEDLDRLMYEFNLSIKDKIVNKRRRKLINKCNSKYKSKEAFFNFLDKVMTPIIPKEMIAVNVKDLCMIK